VPFRPNFEGARLERDLVGGVRHPPEYAPRAARLPARPAALLVRGTPWSWATLAGLAALLQRPECRRRFAVINTPIAQSKVGTMRCTPAIAQRENQHPQPYRPRADDPDRFRPDYGLKFGRCFSYFRHGGSLARAPSFVERMGYCRRSNSCCIWVAIHMTVILNSSSWTDLPGLTMTSHVSFIRQSSMVIFAGHGPCCAARSLISAVS
jgi:hypothetical protein